jgi:hypothetical protein
MTKGYVIFVSKAAFNTSHEAAKTAVGLPIIGNINGKLRPSLTQVTEITIPYPHPSNGTVVAYIDDLWPEDMKEGFVFKTREEVSEYFPVQKEV